LAVSRSLGNAFQRQLCRNLNLIDESAAIYDPKQTFVVRHAGLRASIYFIGSSLGNPGFARMRLGQLDNGFLRSPE